MNMLSYCQAMAAFCRQRARFENEYEAFWIEEAAEWNKLVSGYAGTLDHSVLDHSVKATFPRIRDYSGPVPSGPGPSPDVELDVLGPATSESLPVPIHSVRYRCPKTASQRECCQGHCEVRVEYS